MLTEVSRTLVDLSGWTSYTEAVLATHLLVDLFRGPLRFDDKSALLETATDGFGHRTDIMLILDSRTSVIVEVKKRGRLDQPSELRRAIQQAAFYLRSIGQEYGIVTDYRTWVYFKAVRHGRAYGTRWLATFNAEKHQASRIAPRILDRSQKTTLKHFLQVLAAVHEGMSDREFYDIMNKGHSERVGTLAAKAQEVARVRVAAADEAVLRILYDSMWASDLVLPCLLWAGD